mgnify:CR=1 FL=1
MNKSEVRNIFPYLKNDIIYFNHAATGPFSSLVTIRLNNLLKEKSESNIDDYESFVNVAVETKNILSELIHCNADRIAFLDNTSNAVSYTHLRAHETVLDLVCRLLLEKKKQ